MAKGKKMKFIKIILIGFLLFSFSSNSMAFEKVGTTSFQFLKVITTARAASLADAFTTLPATSEAVFWNPAALTRVQNISASAGYVDWFLDVAHYSFSAAYTVEGIGTFGLQGLMTNVGDIEETTVNGLGYVNGVYIPGLTGKVFSPNATVLGLSYARDLNDRFAFGVTVKYAREDLVYKSVGAVMFDGGFTYNTGYKSIVIGAALRHFGPEVKFIDKSYPLPQTFNIGISSYLISPYDPLIGNYGDHSLLVAYDLIQPRDYDQQHSVGVEYSFGEMLYLRGGYKFNSDQEGISTGIGLKFTNYTIDYAFNDYGDYLDAVHRFTIGFGIN